MIVLGAHRQVRITQGHDQPKASACHRCDRSVRSSRIVSRWVLLWFPRRAELREGGGRGEIALGKSRSVAWRRWCGRSGGLLPHSGAQQQPWHPRAAPCPQVRASAAGRLSPPRLPPRPPAACAHAAQQTPGAAGAPTPARAERTQKRGSPSGLRVETRGACLGQHAGRRAAARRGSLGKSWRGKNPRWGPTAF